MSEEQYEYPLDHHVTITRHDGKEFDGTLTLKEPLWEGLGEGIPIGTVAVTVEVVHYPDGSISQMEGDLVQIDPTGEEILPEDWQEKKGVKINENGWPYCDCKDDEYCDFCKDGLIHDLAEKATIERIGETGDDESGVDYFFIRSYVRDYNHGVSDETLASGIIRSRYGYRCGHSHDCCGCIFTMPPYAMKDEIREGWVVGLPWGRNI